MNKELSLLKANSTPFDSRHRLLEARRPAVVVTISGPAHPTEHVNGFLHLWAMYVCGFNHREHCQKAFRGKLSRFVKTGSTALDTSFAFDEVEIYDSLYICGVAKGSVLARRRNNLHLALEPELGSGFIHETYNGYLIHVENAVKLLIPELAEGWRGLPRAYTRCCNFRFCVHRFGYPGLECVTKSVDTKSDRKMQRNLHPLRVAGF
jgi:hypothetical protein